MQTAIGFIFAALVIALFIAGHFWKRRVIAQEYEHFAEKENSYTLVVSNKNGMPTVEKIILNIQKIDHCFSDKDTIPSLYTVSVTAPSTEDNKTIQTKERNAQQVYFCDINGTASPETTHIALAFDTDNEDAFFLPATKDIKTDMFTWKTPYTCTITSSLFSDTITAQNENFLCDKIPFENK